jgi:dolichol-phosphate mannosyltransferase
MRTLVILPTYNEAENILPLVGQVIAQKDVLEVLVVDDASPDGTGDLVAEAAATEPRLHLIRREAKLGLGSAYVAGFHYGIERGYDLVVTMDGDFSHHPRYLPALLSRHRLALRPRWGNRQLADPPQDAVGLRQPVRSDPASPSGPGLYVRISMLSP